MLDAVLYVFVCCFVVRGCAVTRRYIDVCNCDTFGIVSVKLDHLKFDVMFIYSRRNGCCSVWYVVTDERDKLTP